MSRDYCDRCIRPVSECYCDAIVNIENPINVVILQHPMESNHPYNTAGMTSRSLQHCQLHVGERFAEDWIAQLIEQRSILLFPDMPWLKSTRQLENQPRQLVVIDATWRKAKKILHLNPLLQELPRMAINNHPQTEYSIRSSTIAHSMATIEAVGIALTRLDTRTDYSGLLSPFHRMIKLAKRYKPETN